jgi:hypothetical protein
MDPFFALNTDDILMHNNTPEQDLDAFIFANLDTIDSCMGLFDLSKLSPSESEPILTTHESSSPSYSNDDSSPLSSNKYNIQTSSSEPIFNTNIQTSTAASLNLNNFDKLDLITSINDGNLKPITFTLPEIENDGMKITNEIILSFEQSSKNSNHLSEDILLDEYKDIKIDELELLNELMSNNSNSSSAANDTCIDLEENSDDSEDEDEKIEAKSSKSRVYLLKISALLRK